MLRQIVTRILIAALLLGGVGTLILIGIASFGLVTGEEFAPDTFQQRSYYYYHLPLIQLKITPVTRRTERHALASLLVEQGYIESKSPPKRWDLIAAFRGGRSWRRGDAQILNFYLSAPNDQQSGIGFWETWTNNHSEKARILWPEVAQLARRNLYFLIPPLFDVALEHGQPADLRNDLNDVLARSYEELAGAEQQMGDYQTAMRHYGEALRYDPNRPASIAGRAECRKKLGKSPLKSTPTSSTDLGKVSQGS